jgi:hypothetical protein
VTKTASGTDAWLDRPFVLLAILLAGPAAVTASNVGGREISTFLMIALAVVSAVVVSFDAQATGAGAGAGPERLRDIESWSPSSSGRSSCHAISGNATPF